MGPITYILIVAVILYVYYNDKTNKKDIRKKELEIQTKEINLLKSKYDKNTWDLLASHQDGPGSITMCALGDLVSNILRDRSQSLDFQYQLIITNFIRNGKQNATDDLLQKFSPSQIKKLISYSKGDFPLFLFIMLYLSTEQYRELLEEDIQNLYLLIDLIYSKTITFSEKKILFLEPNERYQLATMFLISWQDW